MDGNGPTIKISNNIPADRRWKILEIAENIRQWGGGGLVNARQEGAATSFSYDGPAGRYIIRAATGKELDERLVGMERVSLAHRELIMRKASYWDMINQCDWDEKTQMLTDDDQSICLPWQIQVIDGVRYSIDNDVLSNKDKARFLNSSQSIPGGYGECDFQWTMPNGSSAEMKLEQRGSDWRLEQLKHHSEACYFIFGKSVHYAKVGKLPETVMQTLMTDARGTMASKLLAHPFIGPADLILNVKEKKVDGGKTIINMHTVRQLAQEPPVNTLEECNAIFAMAKKRGWE